MTTFSLFIPRVFLNISEERIRDVFLKLKYGKVSRVEFVRRKGITCEYNSAYIYFEYWFNTPFAQDFIDGVKNSSLKTTKVVYDMPWYWVILPNTKEKEKEKEDQEDKDLNTILDQMDEVSELIPEATMTLVSSDYVEKLEQHNCFLENKVADLYNMLRSIEEEKMKGLEQERIDLQMELAHMKELLAQYEPDIRYQNKELYH